ncbi:embryogenesis-associated protein EMB8 isoform X2 [Diospyros lotus]|uniref:embryogenesis-associated protein EMB8 isoform X2 n=1 Tax=Diospyros lotus TaxID=55363 RepID=UPI002252B699|nr:embryogenesis-associated protein EMB8 isoform X2 [Diospyros lotus]
MKSPSSMDCSDSSIQASDSPYRLLLAAASLIPVSHYLLGFLFIVLVFLYNFLEVHILQDLFAGFRGQPVSLTFDASSEVYQEIVSKCRILHGRYFATPWLSSPHLQTSFLSFSGHPPAFSYSRQLFHTADNGTMALDWLMNSDVSEASFQMKGTVPGDDKVPIVMVIPGLTSDSSAAYIKHFAFKMAKCGWNVVVSNHRGLGGISITSDCFYNAGWTEDIREIIDHIHHKYPEAPLCVVGTSIGANILVKYLGEDGINTPIAGAAAICSPWDLLICDRFINRRIAQKFYNKALTVGLKAYAQLHQSIISRLTDWDGIEKSRSVRDFDDYVTRVLAKYETVDTYYRRSSSINFVGKVMQPLLCINALDDPVCTREAIPWDECRANKNIVLATTQHGGHLAYYEGMTANSLWWVRAVHEFFNVLCSSSLIHRKEELQIPPLISPLESSVEQSPYVNITEGGLVTTTGDNQTTNPEDVRLQNEPTVQSEGGKDTILEARKNDLNTGARTDLTDEPPQPQPQDANDMIMPVRRYMDQLSRQSGKSFWLLVYVAIVTTWPLVGSAVTLFFKKKFGKVFSATKQRR